MSLKKLASGPPWAASLARLQSPVTNTTFVPSPDRYGRVEIWRVSSDVSGMPGQAPGSPVGETASIWMWVPGPSRCSSFQFRTKASWRSLVSPWTIRADELTKPTMSPESSSCGRSPSALGMTPSRL